MRVCILRSKTSTKKHNIRNSKAIYYKQYPKYKTSNLFHNSPTNIKLDLLNSTITKSAILSKTITERFLYSLFNNVNKYIVADKLYNSFFICVRIIASNHKFSIICTLATFFKHRLYIFIKSKLSYLISWSYSL